MQFHKIRRFLHHYLLPHTSNNYRAKTLHLNFILLYIALLFILQTSFGILRSVKPDILGYATNITVDKLLILINQERQKSNLKPFSLSDELSSAATQKATDMFSQDYWAHISPTGTTPWDFITSSGYNYIFAGENLAKSYNTSQEVVEAWMNSTTHRANILKPEYSDIGLSVMNGKLQGEETTLVVQEFGTRFVKTKKVTLEESTIPSIDKLSGSTNGEIQSTEQKDLTAKVDNSYSTKKIILSNFHLPKSFSLILAEFLLLILFIDSIYIWKYKTIRICGHNLAHIIFLLTLIGAMGATGIGVIL